MKGEPLMKRSFALVCSFAFLFAGCAAGPAVSFSARSAPVASLAPAPTSSPLPRPTPDDPDEARLLAAVEEASGREMLNHICSDLDGDDTKELFGVCYASDSQSNEVWYSRGDAAECSVVYRAEPGLDVCTLEVLNAGGENHVALNRHVGMGTTAFFSILALWDGEVVCLVDDQPGNVRVTDAGDIVLSVESYDGAYQAADDLMLLHTVKGTCIFFDGETYKEYGATELTEEEFSQFKNAGDLKAAIEHDLRFEDYDRLEYRYFLRPNGILQVQCDLHDEAGNISFGYYTVRWKGDELEFSPLGDREPGQMAASLSTLDVVY